MESSQRGVIVVVLLVRAIDILKAFGLIWALFGKATITRVMPIHIYTLRIQTQDYSQGAVLSLILAAVSVTVYFAFRWGLGPVFASGVLSVLPVAFAAFLLQRYIVRGRTLGAFK